MKFTTSVLLISATLATFASAAPLGGIVDIITTPSAARLCSQCTSQDQSALNAIVRTSADHYAGIAQNRLSDLMREVGTARVTSGTTELPKGKATLIITMQSKIDDAKKACTPDALAPAILAAINDDAALSIPWSKSEQAEKKMKQLNAVIEKIILDFIQKYLSAEGLAKDITENMTNTKITPIPETAALVPEAPAPAPAPGSAPEAVASPPAVEPQTSLPTERLPEQADAAVDVNSGTRTGVDVAASVGPKFVCSSGCKDAEDASTVLSLRDDLERQLGPRFKYLANKEIPSDCSAGRSSLWDNIRQVLNNVDIEANVNPSN
ncbi:hypothetical protein BGZ70_008995 [Mortierella alpina]|uniref:Uncharacterized protein n=1 Tax=Mortierella alpina TaxID=64518 RepID=A0A9P6J276_MORAP|nr:hypothetical protein BGZ70_008995 [Mortierella alpina]